MAQLAFPALGAAIGGAIFPGVIGLGITGAGLGWTVGGLLGGAFGPSQKVQGPRLSDLKLTQSSYGSPIPYVIGHPRIGGQIIWGSDRREISTTTSRRAKGGPKVKSTTFTYEIDILIQLTANEMAGVRKMFVNGELQWSAASDADYQTIAASGSLARRITVYTGAADQLPDPTYEAAVGIGNAPAYRGVLTVFFEGLQLGNSGQIPNITFEVMQTSDDAVNYSIIGATPVQGYYIANGTPSMGPDGSIVIVGLWNTSYATTLADVYQISPDGIASFIRRINVPFANTTLSGSTDEALIATWSFPVGYITWADGSQTRMGEVPWRFAKSGNDLVLSPDAPTLSRYNVSPRSMPPALPADAIGLATTAIPDNVNSILIRDDLVYALQENTSATPTVRTIYVRNLEDLSAFSTITTPAVERDSTLLFDDDGALHIVGTSQLWRYDGSAWEMVRTIPNNYGAHGPYSVAGSANSSALIDGVLYTQPYDLSAGNYHEVEVRASWIGADAGDRPLNEVVEELCIRAGIPAEFIDASLLAGKLVRAYAITPSTTRSALEALSQAYQFECVCSDKLRFVPLGGAPKATIPFEDLGAATSGDYADPLPLSERNDVELPAYITVKYMNVMNDYQDGAERSSRIATESEAEQFVEVAMGMTPAEAKQVADFMANLVQASTTSAGPITLQLRHFNLQPTDPIIITDRSGSTYRVRIGKQEWADGISTIEGVFDNASAIISEALTDEDYTETSTIRVPSTTLYVLGDWPLFRDEDDNVGHYWAATSAGSFWTGAALLKSADDVVYQQVSEIEERGVLGSAMTALGNYTGPNIPDEGNLVRVDFGLGTVASITYDEQILESENAFMIGAECVIVREWSYVSDGIYEGRGLLRGRKGTEWAMSTHAVGEAVVLIQPAGLRRVGMDLSELELERYYRAVTFGKSLDSAYRKTFTNRGVSSEPYAATNLDAVRDGTNVTVSWNRRTRLSSNWLLGNVPLGESTESWVIDRYTDGTYTTIAATYTSTTNSVTFANAGTLVYLRIYQISDRVGRGYVLQGAI